MEIADELIDGGLIDVGLIDESELIFGELINDGEIAIIVIDGPEGCRCAFKVVRVG